ncbi:hypothetical protein M5494_004387 [Salmonella enterica]|nr:hypothetical protein [Salmonella enterica]
MSEFKIEITFEKVRECTIDSVPSRGFYWHCPDTDDVEEGFYEISDEDYAKCAASGMLVDKAHLRGIKGTMYEATQKLLSIKTLK